MAEHTSLTCAIEALWHMTEPEDRVLFSVNPPMWHLTRDPIGITKAEVYARVMELATPPAKAKVLVVVDGGVADYAKEGNVEVLKIDRDDDPDATVPSDWETLGEVFGIQTTPPPRDPATILAKLVEALKHLDTPLLQEAKACLAKLPQ